MGFHEIRFPASISFGSNGGPERRTEIVTLANGFEERNTPWEHSRHRYDAGVGLRSLDDIEQILAFFEARRGRLFGFRWKDWSDYRSCPPSSELRFSDQLLGDGDGTTCEFALAKTYRSGSSTYSRPIKKPVAGTVRAGIAGDELQENQHYTVDVAQGIVRFVDPPAIGAQVTAGFEFDVPVRFDTDQLGVSVASFQAGDVPSVPLVEVRI